MFFFFSDVDVWGAMSSLYHMDHVGTHWALLQYKMAKLTSKAHAMEIANAVSKSERKSKEYLDYRLYIQTKLQNHLIRRNIDDAVKLEKGRARDKLKSVFEKLEEASAAVVAGDSSRASAALDCVKRELHASQESDDNCPLCLEALGHDRLYLKCGHLLHRDCIDELMRRTKRPCVNHWCDI